MNRKKLILTGALVLVGLIIFRGGIFDFSLYLHESRSSGTFGCRAGGEFSKAEMDQITFIYLDRVMLWERFKAPPVDFHAPPHTLLVWQNHVCQITPWSWMPFYKSGTSKMIRIYQVFGTNGTVIASGETSYDIDYTAKGILSHYHYVENVLDAERQNFEKDLRKKLTVEKK